MADRVAMIFVARRAMQNLIDSRLRAGTKLENVVRRNEAVLKTRKREAPRVPGCRRLESSASVSREAIKRMRPYTSRMQRAPTEIFPASKAAGLIQIKLRGDLVEYAGY
jgi:hypothetical protein